MKFAVIFRWLVFAASLVALFFGIGPPQRAGSHRSGRALPLVFAPTIAPPTEPAPILQPEPNDPIERQTMGRFKNLRLPLKWVVENLPFAP